VQLSIFWLVIIALVIFEWKGERRWKAKKLKENGKTNKQVEKSKQRNKQKKFQRYKQGETVY
jgi:heme/copper-type cytochrome/quinol oxidase subunit 2